MFTKKRIKMNNKIFQSNDRDIQISICPQSDQLFFLLHRAAAFLP